MEADLDEVYQVLDRTINYLSMSCILSIGNQETGAIF